MFGEFLPSPRKLEAGEKKKHTLNKITDFSQFEHGNIGDTVRTQINTFYNTGTGLFLIL